MNRSLMNVIFGGFGAATMPAGGAQVKPSRRTTNPVRPEDASFLMSNADSVIIVPGYGLAVSRAQHALQEFATLLTEKA